MTAPDVPMPRDLSEEAVAEWLTDLGLIDLRRNDVHPGHEAVRAVRALVEREVAKERASTREAMREACAAEVDRLAALGGTDEKQAICRFVARHLRALPLPPAPADDASGAEAMDDEAANIEQRIGALDKARPGYIARLVRGICGKPVAYICVECGALWRKVKIPSDTAESWNMVSAKGCAGCDNGPKPLFDALYREPVSPARPATAADAVVEALRDMIDLYTLTRGTLCIKCMGRVPAPEDHAVVRSAVSALRGANGGE